MRRIIFSGLLMNFLIHAAHSQVNFTSSNLPVVVIHTNGQQIPDEPKIPAVMGIIDNGPGQINSVNDPFNDFNGNIGIELRGSSSQSFPKKSFGVETWNENQQDTAVSILGMPEEDDWVLHGPYSDKSLIRNVLAFKLGRDLGRYASRTRLCELILNDTYWGVYVFMEKVKRDNDRVDISKLNPDEISGDDLTGGYIVKIDKFDGSNSGQGWASPYRPPNYQREDQNIFFQLEYPKNDEIVPQQKAYIQQYVTDFETALKTRALDDPVAGYKSYIDVESFVDYAIINEITRNIDAYRLSTFLYKDKASEGGKLFIGPIWDYNLAFGNADYCEGWQKEGWAWDFNDICNGDFWLIPFWWKRFMMDPEFTTLLKNRWLFLRSDLFSTANIQYYIDSVSMTLFEPQYRNFQRWPVLGQYVWPNYYVGNTYQDEVSYMKTWIEHRLMWLDGNIDNIVTSLDESFPPEDRIKIYPNPFDQDLMITWADLAAGLSGNPPEVPIILEIYNAHGVKLYSSRLNKDENTQGFHWDGKDSSGHSLPTGM
ncbi:MAG: CotH kinase family protein, partial [Cyclobacteriaceae bacterium]|nr:CotH kinase family protein [Cyclobacteriaceae bacterium]